MSAQALRVGTDHGELDFAMIHDFLSTHSAWARDIPAATLRRALAGSLCFGGYLGERQVAFARVISDQATFAYLADVFVLPAHRGQGYADQLMKAIAAHPALQGLRRFMLATSDAHGLHARHGFGAPARPASLMEIYVADVYAASAAKRAEPITR